jgi:probable rRNA maturation factor
VSASIHFFTENIQFKLRDKKILRKWICAVSLAENKKAGEISFVFCDDDFLSEINIKYLKHNTLTDIITFPFSEKDDVVSGDIYISLPRVRENALKFKDGFDNELHRVMIHGILHLLGFRDTLKREKLEMRNMEDSCLALLRKIKP